MLRQEQERCNPAVVGLAGFAFTTLLLQLHNLDLCGIAPVVATGLVFGGAAQMTAGFLEMNTGNTFGFCAFTGYGAFWLSLSTMMWFKASKLFLVTDSEIGCFLIVFAIFTALLWVVSLRLNKAMFVTFSSLLLGFILLILEKFIGPVFLVPAACVLIFCSGSALYILGHLLLKDVYGNNIFPLGKAFV